MPAGGVGGRGYYWNGRYFSTEQQLIAAQNAARYGTTTQNGTTPGGAPRLQTTPNAAPLEPSAQTTPIGGSPSTTFQPPNPRSGNQPTPNTDTQVADYREQARLTADTERARLDAARQQSTDFMTGAADQGRQAVERERQARLAQNNPNFMVGAAEQGRQAEVDAQIAKLSRELLQTNDPAAPDTSYLNDLSKPFDIAPVNLSGITSQTDQVKQLLDTLRQGKGLPAIDVSTDPAANAMRIAAKREAANTRASEADRQAASGTSGSGEFDSAVSGANERAGQNISTFEGNLANQRHTEQLNTALHGADLMMGDLGRQTQAEQNRYTDAFTAEQARREGLRTRAAQAGDVYQGGLAASRAKQQQIQALIDSLRASR